MRAFYGALVGGSAERGQPVGGSALLPGLVHRTQTEKGIGAVRLPLLNWIPPPLRTPRHCPAPHRVPACEPRAALSLPGTVAWRQTSTSAPSSAGFVTPSGHALRGTAATGPALQVCRLGTCLRKGASLQQK